MPPEVFRPADPRKQERATAGAATAPPSEAARAAGSEGDPGGISEVAQAAKGPGPCAPLPAAPGERIADAPQESDAANVATRLPSPVPE